MQCGPEEVCLRTRPPPEWALRRRPCVSMAAEASGMAPNDERATPGAIRRAPALRFCPAKRKRRPEAPSICCGLSGKLIRTCDGCRRVPRPGCWCSNRRDR
ncbi:hypothetical protein DF057_29605 [Burkholderia cepacia]|nr:hypothetical protein [Burkholderia sp. HAN2018]RQZ57014.1 hypothetical protein DF057_29605 [Burkholderia cepacia]